jgi:hypothetical protein
MKTRHPFPRGIPSIRYLCHPAPNPTPSFLRPLSIRNLHVRRPTSPTHHRPYVRTNPESCAKPARTMDMTAKEVTLATVRRRRKKTRIGRTRAPLHTSQTFSLMVDTCRMQRRKLPIKRKRTEKVIRCPMVMSPSHQRRHNKNQQRSLAHV